MSMEVLNATEDWISHFDKYKDQMYMTICGQLRVRLLR